MKTKKSRWRISSDAEKRRKSKQVTTKRAIIGQEKQAKRVDDK
jgi:hypothetical protein